MRKSQTPFHIQPWLTIDPILKNQLHLLHHWSTMHQRIRPTFLKKLTMSSGLQDHVKISNFHITTQLSKSYKITPILIGYLQCLCSCKRKVQSHNSGGPPWICTITHCTTDRRVPIHRLCDN